MKKRRPQPSRKKAYRRRTQRPEDALAASNVTSKRLATALKQHESADFKAAEATYSKLLKDDPTNAQAWHAAGLLALQQNVPSRAAHRLERAVELDACSRYLAAAAVAALLCGDVDQFEKRRMQADALAYRDARLYERTAQALERQARWSEAALAWQAALAAAGASARQHLEASAALEKAGNPQEAANVLHAACRQYPDWFQAHNNLAVLQHKTGDLPTAIRHFQEALRQGPADPTISFNLALASHEWGDDKLARQVISESLASNPQASSLLLADALLLPVIYESREQLAEYRSRLEHRVSKLLESDNRFHPLETRTPAPFPIAYQGFDDRPFASRLSKLFHEHAAGDEAPGQSNRHRIERDWRSRRLRVGFLSSFFREHTVSRLTRGLLANIDKSRFECRVYAIGSADACSRWIAERVDSFDNLPANAKQVHRRVSREALDVLVYPDVGMDAATTAVARTRLAPVQVAMWGHPVTTGMPSIDHFISARALEREGAAVDYSENLVLANRLPSFYYRPSANSACRNAERSQWQPLDPIAGVPPNWTETTWYLCPQSLFKLHPDFDEIIQGILDADPRGSLLLLNGNRPLVRRMLETRWEHTLDESVRRRIYFLPPQDNARFLSLLAAADVMLDPVHFGGGNTSYEAAAVGTPVVTMPSKYLRGRVTLGIYRQMGLDATVVSSAPSYVETAVRVANDRQLNRRLRSKICERHDAIFEDVGAIHDFERFLAESADRAATIVTD